MTRIEDRLTAAARKLRADVDGEVGTADVAPSTGAGRGWRPLLLAAAAVIALVAVVGLTLSGDDDGQLVADEGDPTPTPQPDTTPSTDPAPVEADIAGEVIGKFRSLGAGSMAFLGVEDALTDAWALAEASGPVPTIDFEERAVVAFAVSSRFSCMDLVGFDEDAGALRPRFDGRQPRCDLIGGPPSYFLAVDRADLPTTFDLVLDADLLDDGEGPYTLSVDTSENFTSFAPPQPGSGDVLVPGAPDLERPENGREVTFDRIADVALGDTLPLDEIQVYEGRETCGYWGPGEPSHDGDEPLDGLVMIEGDTATVSSINVRRNPRYRTASGVGVGTTLESLQRVYGDDLVVDRADAPNSPTDGLLGQYSDVAAVRNGDRALTFQLSGDVVFGVKLSDADSWGDDEGCA